MKHKNRTAILASVAILSVMVLTGCSTIGENTSQYFSQMGSVQSAMFSSGAAPETSETTVTTEEENKVPLDAPANFTLDEDGNFSFDAVENAGYYLLYECETGSTDDNDPSIDISSQIEEDGSATYSGNVKDYFSFAYGEKLIKVYALPSYTDTEYDRSPAVMGEFRVEGEIAAPELSYVWDIFSDSLNVKIDNSMDYMSTAYPDEIIITVTNENDASDEITVTADGGASLVQVTGLKQGETYGVSGYATSSSEYVTNDKTDVSTAEPFTVGEDNHMSSNYTYNDTLLFWGYSWPYTADSFDFAGGSAGMYQDLNFEATLKDESEDGAMYSYDLLFSGPSTGTAASTTGSGWMNVYEDGTFECYMEAVGPDPAVTIWGEWKENGDGTIFLNYDHNSISEYKED